MPFHIYSQHIMLVDQNMLKTINEPHLLLLLLYTEPKHKSVEMDVCAQAVDRA